MPSRSIHVAANRILFPLGAEYHCIVCVFACGHIFIHSSTDGHLDCFHILATVNNAAITIVVYILLQYPIFTSFEYILRSGTAGSYDSSIFSVVVVV